eukprot:NODE_10376_length_520_cov_28.057935_g9728_i0.p1 GENE.NODE_10376_length_520_cov_28.057935_g9728_i0~~NODE_10376_length_520_cov_28.057935_g9728_i0.p1  ORF type:complete len:163 (+),score=21.11 NODE_10376_length_520_cov_28.057935_g9728_i0:62-490(+)
MSLIEEAESLVRSSLELYSLPLPKFQSIDSNKEVEIHALQRKIEILEHRLKQQSIELQSQAVRLAVSEGERDADIIEGQLKAKSLTFIQDVVNSNVSEWLREIEKCTLYHLQRCCDRIEELNLEVDRLSSQRNTSEFSVKPY